MSMMGTGVSAGVAQAGLQAQQVARERDRKKAQDDHNAQRTKDTFESHLHALEKVEQVEQVQPQAIDEHLPEHHAPNDDAQSSPGQSGQAQAEDQPPPAPAAAGPRPAAYPPPPGSPSDHGGQLYHHLDVSG